MKKPALILAAVLCLSAHAEVVEVAWTGKGTASREFNVAPGKFAEWCTRLRRGENVRWQFEAATPVDFNVHYHEGKEVRFPTKQDAVAVSTGTLQVAADQDYCWMWTNKRTASTVLKVLLEKKS